jgi:CubicO group peptidase (beta-lactamase class C family)
MSRGTELLVALVLGAFAAPCGAANGEELPGRRPWPKDGWPTSTPEEQGIDSRKLVATLDSIRAARDRIHSLTIIRNGYLVLDATFFPYEAGGLHDLASCTKSFTSALVGAAIGKGLIRDVRQPMLELFPRHTVSGADPRKQDILVEHLLTMTSGLNCGLGPQETELFQQQGSPDWVQFALNLKMAQPPGAGFAYCSPGVHLLAGMIQETSRMSPLEFARENLLEPMGIKDVIWPADPQGVNCGSGDLRLRPLDMARFGYLYLRRGEWDGTRLLPEEWVIESFKPHVELPAEPGAPDRGYGYLWWLWPGVYRANGRGGQVIAVWPDKDMVVVMTGAGYRAQDILLSHILPAAVADEPLPEDREALDLLQARIDEAKRAPSPSPVPPLPPLAGWISGMTYRLNSNWIGMKSLRLTFSGGEARMDATLGQEALSLAVGLDDVYRVSPGRFGLPAACRGSWKSENVFVAEFDEIGNNAHWWATMTFIGDRLVVDMLEATGLPGVKAEGRADP